MPNNNAEYWANRFAMLKDAQYKKADEYVKELGKVYRQIRSDLEKDLAKWYNRLAENNEVSLAEAKRMLDNEELEEFKWTVEQYIERASDAGLARKYMKELENASARVHIRRVEAMGLQIEYYVALLMNSEEKGINELLSGLYSDTYYQAIYEMQKGSGIGAEFTALNTQTIENIMLKPWADDGLSFGKRIREKYGPEFVNRLSKTLSRSLISGDSQRKLARSLEKDFDLAEGQAERLIQTESAFFIEAATLKSYEETGVDEYKILATLDYKTSEICRSMDGKVFSRKDAVTGVNYPPFHCRCRTTTVPLTGYEDMFEPGERVARNADGDIYYVPEDMTYPEWYKKYVESDPEEALKVKKLKNRRADEEQYERYKKRLGKENVPETLDMWQEKKYTDDEWWTDTKGFYRYKGENPKADRKAYECATELKERGVRGDIHIPPKEIDISELGFDDNHVNAESEHKVTEEEAKAFVKNAKMSHTVWQEQYENYYSEEGAAYVNVEDENNKFIRTAYKREQFEGEPEIIMEVLGKHGI